MAKLQLKLNIIIYDTYPSSEKIRIRDFFLPPTTTLDQSSFSRGYPDKATTNKAELEVIKGM
jgi:hypothetical protein